MKVLELNRHVFVLYWILSAPTNKSFWFKLRNIIFYISTAILLVFGLITSACFVLKYVSVDLEASLFSVFQMAAYVSPLYLLIVGFILRSKFVEMFPKLQKIYDENQHSDKSKFMEKADETAQFITKCLTQYTIIGWYLSGIVTAGFSAIYSIIQTRSIHVEQWYAQLKWILPWNQKSVLGWIVETLFSNGISAAHIIVNYMFLSFFIGICLYHRAYFNHIQSLIAELIPKNRNSQQSKPQLVQVIRFHISAKEIFSQSAEAFSSCILIILICSMILLACSMFQLDLATRHPNFNIALLLIAIGSGTLTLFLYCFFGESATDAYLDISDCYFNANWPKLQANLQKYFVLMIANAQRPLHYHGFGIANLELNTFLRMLKTVISYYMMFKAVTK